jgi:hypothetical protein
METEDVELPAGMLARNVRYTRGKFSRPREMVERPKRDAPVKRRGWGNST